MLSLSSPKKTLLSDRVYFFISIFAIATLMVLSFPGKRLFAAAETINCDGNSRTLTVGTYTDSTGSQFSSGADLTLAQGSGACTFTITVDQDTTISLASLTIESGVTVTHEVAGTTLGTHNRLALTITGDLIVNSGGSIDVSGKGYIGGYASGNFFATGYTEGNNSSGSGQLQGGSHGGYGGRGSQFSSIAEIYDSITNPIYPGGGAGGLTTGNYGGNGGGVVRITAASSTIDGTITAEGGDGFVSSDGAGGTVYLNITGDLNGSGTISAAGNGGDANDAGGGGGRIALYYATLSSSLTLNAAGGNSTSGSANMDGSPGTIYKKPSGQTYGDLSIDGGSSTSYYQNTIFPATVPTSDQVAAYGSGYVFNSITVGSDDILNISSSVDDDSSGTANFDRKLYVVGADCPADDDDSTNGEIVYNTTYRSDGVATDYTCNAPQKVVEFTTTSSSDVESVTPVSLGIRTNGVLGSDITIDYAIKAASTTATGGGTDYTLSSGTATIDGTTSTTQISLVVVDDAARESSEIVAVELSNPSTGAVSANSVYEYTIQDNDTPGVTITESTGTSVNEGSTTDTYTITLDSPPASDVTITVTGDDEVTVSTSSIVFQPSTWNVPRTVTTTPVDDSYIEGSHTGTTTHSATSSDVDYEGISISDVVVSISDNDFAGVTVTQTGTGTTVTENGGTDTYTLVLNAIPSADVAISISTDADSTVSTSSVVFTTSTWNVERTVTVSAVDDADQEGSHTSNISHSATSTDTDFDGVFVSGIFASVTDNDTPDVDVTATDFSTNGYEGGGTDTFTVVLLAPPSDTVTIHITTSSDDGAVSPTSLTFTTLNWSSEQTVTFSAVDDATPEAATESVNVNFSASSTDSNYEGITISGIFATVYDNDQVTITESGGTTEVTEGGATDSYTVVLATQPDNDVTVSFTTSSSQISLATTSMTFTTLNWDTPQTMTVTATDDVDTEGDHSAYITHSVTSFDSDFSSTYVANVTTTIHDNDATAAVTLAESSSTTTISEAGATDTYTIVLDTQPTNDVTVAIATDADSTVSTSSIVFTAANWDTPQTITVTAVNDSIDEGDHSSTISHSATSADGDYNNIVIDSISATVTDDGDTAGFTVSAISASTTESGATSTFTIVLTSQPTGPVTTTLSSSDTTEGTVSPSSVTFTESNWNTPQTIVVTGVDDDIDDGNVSYTIVVGSASSDDAGYVGLNPSDVSVSNTDNDTAGFTVSAISGNTTEAGGTATFTVVLNTEPTDDVTIGLSSSDIGEAAPTTDTLIFTTLNWDTPQTVTVTGSDDVDDDGDIGLTIILAAADSDDTNYDGINPDDVAVTNTDNDAAAAEDGGGGAAPSASPSPVSSIIPPQPVITREAPVVLTSDTPVVIRAGSASHRVTKVRATDESATIIVESKPLRVTLKKNELKELDTDRDGKSDLSVQYFGLVKGSPKFVFTDLTMAALPVPPKPVIINNGASSTDSRTVTVEFNVNNAELMAISEQKNFSNVSYQPFASNTTWVLSSEAGEKRIYVRFRTKRGEIADASDTILYTGKDTSVGEIPNLKMCNLVGKTYKVASSPAVYLIGETHDDKGNVVSPACAKRVFTNPATYFSYFNSWSDITVVEPAFLNAIPNDDLKTIPYGPRYTPAEGTLIKTISDPKVFLVFGGQKHWIESEVVFKAAGFMFGWVKEVVKSVFDDIPTGDSVDSLHDIPQEVRGVNPMPELGPSSAPAAPSVSARQFTQFLGIGSTGSEVLALQQKLKTLGYFTPEPTGYFGPVTAEAVKKFQGDRGIDVRGYVGPATREALNSL